jgi:8-oxo-dGTP diphosphatase
MAVCPPMVCVAAAALIDEASRVLLQKRPQDRQHGGLWEFPGGKIEQGEGPVAAVIREIFEELGLQLFAEDLFPVSFCATEAGARPQVVLMLFGCRRWQGSPVCEDGAALEWVNIENLAGRAMPPLDVPLAKALQAMQKRP